MTKEELTKVPFRFVCSMALEHEHITTYTNDDYDIGCCKHTIKRKDGGFGRTYRHYRFRDKIYKTLPKFLEAIKEVKFNGNLNINLKLTKNWMIMAKKKTENVKMLHLPLKAKWYEMIESGVKTEEYREIKPYWIKRLCDNWVGRDRFIDCMNNCCINCIQTKLYNLYKYDAVKFSYGYTMRTMTFEIESITIGKGKPEWGAPAEEVFIIKLGKRV